MRTTARLAASFALCASLLPACTKDKVEDVDTKLDVKGKTSDETIGLNDKDQVIIQTEQTADVELQSQEMANYNLRERLSWSINDLKECRASLADPRLGGSGESEPIPEVDSIEIDNPGEKFGKDEDGQLKLVKRELYTQRLKNERERGAKLAALLKMVKGHNDRCQQELRTAKIKHGVDPDAKKP